MGRPPRRQVAGYVYHVLNRGNGGVAVFHKPVDYGAFLDLLVEAKAKFSVRILGFCLMPNHFHVVLQPLTDNALSPFMHWWQTTHVRRYHRHYGGHGHLWQGRFKSFPVQQDDHLLIVLRYVLRNPVRAGLARHTDEWPWSSRRAHFPLDPWPVEVPADWEQWVETPIFPHELVQIRTSVSRQAPLGTLEWQAHTADRLGLRSTLRPPHRPTGLHSDNGARHT